MFRRMSDSAELKHIKCIALRHRAVEVDPISSSRPHRRFPESGEPMPPDHPLEDLPDKRPFNYRLQHGVSLEPPDHSVGWRRCGKCSVLFFESDVEDSNGPVGGTHEAAADSPVLRHSVSDTKRGLGVPSATRRRCPGAERMEVLHEVFRACL